MSQNSEQGISVLMPVHNGGKYLQTAVESILNQTHSTLELIIIDDHSTDHAIENLNLEPRLRVTQSPAKGIVPALNHGAAHAKYSVIARMDDDDIALPNRLETQLNILLNSPKKSIVGAQVELFSEEAEIAGGYRRYQEWVNQQTSPVDIAKNFWIESCIPHPTAMMYRDALLELGGYHDSSWPEDYDLWCRAHLAGYTFIKPDDQILLKWRDYPKRTSRVEERYNTDQFLRCKARYLSELLFRNSINECMVWGTGPTGTKLHNYLEERGVKVNGFIDVNPKLVGRKKYDKPIHVLVTSPSVEELSAILPMTIIAVSSWGGREKIKAALSNAKFVEGVEYIFAA